ncbi:saccharopine dehydrogenase [Paenibacillus sp. PK3_47]|uniref:saccharopine dehydrogenase family protein n=1 Tax=Paenibacillus sp. PK3_47 TaxID=2072642 RepID=UPI00201E6297|nr:saccharopine dehydrogenase NADP-binding domain-containing protein [Paenibacillus sp. PK3_47]UQZ36174.1 saccharopine dehydrogenase [Paenibacillus sp. PK3_47]
MKTDIVVVGGYGHVGSQICTLLGEQYPGRVFAAGRSLERAEQFSRATGGRVLPMQLTAGEADMAFLQQTKLVVMCLDQQDTSFAEACLQSGTHYVDITANGAFLTQLQRLGDNGYKLPGTALLSVGLAPGLTNLLAKEATQSLDSTEQLDISIMLGLGDSHGQAALEWTVDSLGTAFELTEQGSTVTAASFTGRKAISFGGPIGKRPAYRFPFSDQQTLPETLNVPSVSTRLCFDSRPVTAGIALLQKLGLTSLFRNRRIRNFTVGAFSRLKFGSEQYAVKVDAYGVRQGTAVLTEWGIQGYNEAAVTARVAAGVALSMCSGTFAPGIYHIEQLFKLKKSGAQLLLGSAGPGPELHDYPIDGVSVWSGPEI